MGVRYAGVQANSLIFWQKEGCVPYMGACYMEFYRGNIIVVGNSGRTGKNSGGLVNFFRQRLCGSVTFSTKLLTLPPDIYVVAQSGSHRH